MLNRTSTFASAVVLTVLTIAALSTVSDSTARAADDCLANPKSWAETPKGSHWYYRIERGTKRKCWYLGDAGKTVSQVATPKPASAEKPGPQRTSATSLQTDVADARAELPAAKPAIAPPAVAAANPPGAEVRDADSQQWALASRWSNQPIADASPDIELASTSTPDQNAQSGSSPPATEQPAPTLATATANRPPAVQSPPAAVHGSLRMLLMVLAGALVLAALLGQAIFKYAGRLKFRLRRDLHGQRHANWRANSRDGVELPAYPWKAEPRPPPRPAREPQHPDPVHELEQLLLQAAKRTTSATSR